MTVLLKEMEKQQEERAKVDDVTCVQLAEQLAGVEVQRVTESTAASNGLREGLDVVRDEVKAEVAAAQAMLLEQNEATREHNSTAMDVITAQLRAAPMGLERMEEQCGGLESKLATEGGSWRRGRGGWTHVREICRGRKRTWRGGWNRQGRQSKTSRSRWTRARVCVHANGFCMR